MCVAQVSGSILTLWELNDEAGPQVVHDFYTALSPAGPTWEGKMTKAAALRQAQLKMLAKKRHPKSWAPYILTGDWGK